MTPSGCARTGRSACSRDTYSAQHHRTRRNEAGLGSARPLSSGNRKHKAHRQLLTRLPLAAASMIHLEPGHRIVAEAVAARVHSAPDKREAVDVRCSDFGAQYYVSVQPEEKHVVRVSLWLRCYEEIAEAVGQGWFQEFYAGMVEAPQAGYKLTLAVNLDRLPADSDAKDALVRKLASVKRDVTAAPLWICFKALLEGGRAPRPHYSICVRPGESMYVIPQSDLVVVVFSICFENQVEAAVAKVFLQEIEISRRQSRDLATAPSVTYTHDAPHELKQIKGLDLSTAPGFIGYVSLAISKRNLDGGRMEKCITLVEGYRAYLNFHVKATKSQLHTRIRSRSSTWLQVLNRAMPEKLNAEKKTITGRTFKR